MKRLFTSSGCVILTFAFFALGSVLSPTPAAARWHDNSPKGTDLTPVLVVGGVVAAACVVYAIVKHNGKDRANKLEVITPAATQSPKSEKSDTTTVQTAPVETKLKSSDLQEKKNDTKLRFFFDAAPGESNGSESNRQLDLSNVTLKTGLTLSF